MKRLTQDKDQKNFEKVEQNSSFKKVKVSVLALTLIHSSIPMSVFAESTKASRSLAQATSGTAMRTIVGGLNTVTGLAQNLMSQGNVSKSEIQAMQEFKKSQQDAQIKLQNRRMSMAFSCPLGPEPIVAPIGACSVGGSFEIPSQALAFGQNILNEYVSFKKPRNAPPYIGNQCLDNGLKSISDNFDAMTKDYEKMLENYEAELKKVAEIQKKNLTKIKELNSLLNGGGNNVSQDFRNTDFNKLLPASCVDAYDVNTIIKKKGGLVGLKDKMSKDDREAKRYRGSSLISIRNQIERDKKKLAANLKKVGFVGDERQDIFAGTQFKSLFSSAKTMASADTTYQTQKVQRMLKSLGVSDTDLPDPKDPSFLIKVDRLASKSDSAYQEKFILDCMTGNNRAAYSTPLSKSISEFNHVKLGNQGDALSTFKRAASGAFSSPSSISALDSTVSSIANSDIRITVTNSNGKSISKTASEYYADIKNECSAIFKGDLAPAGDVANLETYRAEAKQLKQEAQKLKKYANGVLAPSGEGSIIAQIDEMIYNCSGKAVELKNCEQGTYDSGKPSFCITQAAACSDNLNKCSTFTENLVNTKTQELKQKADLYNAQMQQQEQKAKAMMASMQTHMQKVADSAYKQMFPGMTPAMAVAFGIPAMTGLQFDKLADLDLPMSDSLTPGVLLEKDPEQFLKLMMKNLEKNKDSLRSSLKTWHDKQVAFAEAKVNENKSSLDEEISKWRDFVSNCSTKISERNSAIAKAQKDAADGAQKAKEEQLKFCTKLRGLQDGSVGPGCTGDNTPKDLYSDAVEIASVLQAQQSRGPASLMQSNSTFIFEQISEYEKLCDRAGKEGILDSDSDKDGDDETITTACSNSGSTDSLLDSIKDKMTKGLTKDEKKYESELVAYLEDKSAGLSDEAKKAMLKKTQGLIYSYHKMVALNKNMKKYDEGNDQFGICEALDMNVDKFTDISCAGKDGTAKETCIGRKEDSFNENPSKALGITSAARAISLTMSPGIQNEWNAIGEKYSGTACAAINGSQYGQKGALPGLFEKISRDIASDGFLQ